MSKIFEKNNNDINFNVNVNLHSNKTPDLDETTFENFEDSLEQIGGFSWFQIYAIVLILIPEIPAAMIALMPIFVGSSHVDFICESKGDFENVWVNRTLYGNDDELCDGNCSVVSLESISPFTSVVQEWSLICDRAWITELFTSIQMFGMMVGAFLTSQLADAYGRKKLFYGAVATMGIFCFISGWAQDIYLYSVMKFFAGVGVGGFYVVYQIYMMEFLTPSWRTLAGCLSIWSVGICTLSLLAYLLPSWRHLTWAGSAPSIVLALLYFLIPDSPRWLLCKQKTEEARKALKTIARMNRRPALDSESISKLQEIILKEVENENESLNKSQSRKELYKNSKLRVQLGLFIFGWFTVAFVYYGMSFNTKNLSGDPYLNVLYLGLVDLPAFPSGVLFNNWLGRRKTYGSYLIFASVFLITLVIVDQTVESSETITTILLFLGRFGVGGAWGVLMCFTAEAFPTVCRSTALGLCALAGNIGGVLAPQLAFFGTIYPSTPYFIFAGLCIASVCSTWLLPETNKKELQNFVSQSQ